VQHSTQLSLIAFLVTLAALPGSDALAATAYPTDRTDTTGIIRETQTVDDRLSRLAAVFEQRASEAENSADLPSEFSSLLAGFINGGGGGFRNGGGGGFRNGGGGGFINGGGGGFRNGGGGGGGFVNFRNY
jgi:rSAM-associated Gly-rich repeat protein